MAKFFENRWDGVGGYVQSLVAHRLFGHQRIHYAGYFPAFTDARIQGQMAVLARDRPSVKSKFGWQGAVFANRERRRCRIKSVDLGMRSHDQRAVEIDVRASFALLYPGLFSNRFHAAIAMISALSTGVA